MKGYQKPDFNVTEYQLGGLVALSWSDEETDEALTNERIDNSSNWEDDFWESRE